MKVLKINRLWILFLSLFATVMVAGCSSSDDDDEIDTSDDDWTSSDDYDIVEQAVFDAWIEVNRPNLVDSRQEDGYYIEILSEDKDLSYPKTNTTSCWVEYNITSKDLDGNICHTRNEMTAIQQGTFTLYTRYAPTKRFFSLINEDIYEDYYSGDADDFQLSALEQVIRATEMTIDGVTEPFDLTVGSKIRLWMPSRLIDGGGNGSGGYAGQYSISSGRPMITEVEITNVVVDAEQNEREVLDWFRDSQEVPSDWEFVLDPYADHIYVNHYYTPYTNLNYLEPYNYTQLDEAANFEELEALINETLIEVFGEGKTPTRNESKFIDDETCYMWYITRTLDGFIVDTNIEEVKELIYKTSNGTSEDDGTRLSFYKDTAYDTYVRAFYYSIPELEYGQWATIITTSGEGYGMTGVTGSSSSTEILPFSSLIFQLYIEYDN
ncbi:MAG: hypothetical protein R3Y39_04665 [Rikenellaceae bacterium]